MSAVGVEIDQALNDLGRFRTAINQIAQKDQLGRLAFAIRFVALDSPEQFRQLFIAAVNVADRINPLARRDRSLNGALRHAAREKTFEHGRVGLWLARGYTEDELAKQPWQQSFGFCLLTVNATIAAMLLGICNSRAARAETGQSSAQTATLERIRAIDMRMAAIGYRIATANAPLCTDLEPATGLHLHTLDQYVGIAADIARARYGFETRVSVGGVVPGSPAADAGIRPDESIAAIADWRTPIEGDDGRRDPTALVNALYDTIAVGPPSTPLSVELRSGGASRSVILWPVPACRTRFEVDLASGLDAEADGRLVKVKAGFFDRYDDDLVAVVVAHELSHNILRHRARLNDVGVSRGILAGFGRNVRYFRQTEIEADILAVHLLANAGYDPMLAGRFWRDYGPRAPAGFLSSRTHPGWRDRAIRSDLEASRIAAGGGNALAEAFVKRRTLPLDGDWQSLLRSDSQP
jgi:hypothetical protein